MLASVKRRTRRIFRHIVKGRIFSGSQQFFVENGKLLLEERIALFHGKTNPIRCFSVDELSAMITGVNDDLSDEYKWYNGDVNGRPVLIKKTNRPSPRGYFCREIAVAAQMSTHKNVLKLLGCCLETEYPVLVYDNDEHCESLYDRICVDEKQKKPRLERNDRLRIAWEISHAVAYLHSAFPRPIIHRDLKPSLVLLDKDNSAKLSGFDLSVSIPKGEPYVEVDRVIGTFGFIDPVYMLYAMVSEKTDVYSFGALFLELITGEHVWDLFRRIESDYSNNEVDSFDVEAPITNDELPRSVVESFDAEPHGTNDEPHEFDVETHSNSDELHRFDVELGDTNDELRRPSAEQGRSGHERLAYAYLEGRHISKVFDPSVQNDTEAAAASNEYIMSQQFNESIRLVLKCMAEHAESRPTMEEVANKLNNIINASYDSHVLAASTRSTIRESEDLSNEAQGMECITEELLPAEQARNTTNQDHEMGYDGRSKSFMTKGRILGAAIPWLLFSLIFVPLLSLFYH